MAWFGAGEWSGLTSNMGGAVADPFRERNEEIKEVKEVQLKAN